jgi:hypothetical protein
MALIIRNLFLSTLLLWSSLAFSCSLAGLQFEPKFGPHRAQLDASEILRFSDWLAKKAGAFPSGGEFGVFVRRNAAAGTNAQLAEKRRKHLNKLLEQFGISTESIEYSLVEDYGLSIPVVPPLRDLVDTSAITFNPRCPHPCCPGPEPIKNKS